MLGIFQRQVRKKHERKRGIYVINTIIQLGNIPFKGKEGMKYDEVSVDYPDSSVGNIILNIVPVLSTSSMVPSS